MLDERWARRAGANPKRAVWLTGLSLGVLALTANCGTPTPTFSSDVGGSGASDSGRAGSGGHNAAGTAAGGTPATAGNAGDPGAACPYDSCDCVEGDTRPCGPPKAVGICKPGTQACAQGAWGECVGFVEAVPRDCTSALDNDCNGSPDNTVDDACKCVPGTKEACGDHPGLDGKGACTAGERACVASGNAGVWGTCVGSVPPKAADVCDIKGDDGNCDGQANGGCTCVTNDKSTCADVYASKGECAAIALTCTTSGKWPGSASCAAKPRDCSSALDNDCNGLPDNTIDSSCKCIPGTKEACGDHPGLDGNGACKAGERVCMASGNMGVWGTCVGSVPPKAADACDIKGDDGNCDGQANGGCTCITNDKSTCADVYTSKGECAAIALTCNSSGKWPSSASCAATKTEVCAADGKDENCDGQVNENCECTGGSKVCGDCDEGAQACSNGKYGACVKVTPALKGPQLICIKGGSFDMGSNRQSYEQPIHPVSLPSYWMDETEVTVSQYKACSTAGVCAAAKTPAQSFANCTSGVVGHDNFPVNCVNKVESATYCSWVGKRLSTEEEWEYAARGTDGRMYPWGNAAFSNQANVGSSAPVAVASYANGKSPFGLYDMAGNVREWNSTNACPYPASGPSNCGTSGLVMTRGGAYFSDAAGATTTYRYSDDPTGTGGPDFGFRCAKNK